MLKILIVDDEAKARRILEELLKEYCPDTQIVGMANDVPSAVQAIHKFQPDLVLLDIEMPSYTGFQLLDFFEKIDFEIIFTTAYREFALQAFEVSAIDYLLKPIQIERLVNAIEKAKTQKSKQIHERIEVLKTNLQQQNIQKLALPVSEGLLFVEVAEIMYLLADGAYTQIVLTNGKKILVSRNIKNFEESLPSPHFFRPHRSYLINLNCVKQYLRQDGGIIVMQDNAEVYVSKDRKEDFLKIYLTLK